VLALGVAGIGSGFASFGNQLWLPQIIQAMDFSNFLIGFVVALFNLNP
jgi:hypothetical protein